MCPQILLMHKKTGDRWSKGDQRMTRLTCFPYAVYLIGTVVHKTLSMTDCVTQESAFLFIYSIITLKKAQLASRGDMDKLEEKNAMWSYK